MTWRRPVVVSVTRSGRTDEDPALQVGLDTDATIAWLDPEHAILSDEPAGRSGGWDGGTRLWLGPLRIGSDGISLREVVVDGWRFEIEVEDLARADLRRRASRSAAGDRAAEAVQVVAELPGRIARLLVGPGEPVEQGQALLVIEAMKMLNEVRAPRSGVVRAVAVSEGGTIERGDLLVTLG
jgi:biotin carboxyl carrier protein